MQTRYRRATYGIGFKPWHAVVAVVVIIIAIMAFSSYQSVDSRTVTICDKERSDGEYRIYTSDGTFVMKDIYFGDTRFNTADAYGKLKVGETYELKFKGWRIPLFSEFPNITEATPASSAPPSGSC